MCSLVLKNLKKINYKSIYILIVIAFIWWLPNLTLKYKTQNLNSQIAKAIPKKSLITTVIPTETKWCEIYHIKYQNLTKLKQEQNLRLRFENIHLQIKDKIYRIRRFFADGPEGELETFIAYFEDQEEYPHIIEKKVSSPGIIYKKLHEEKKFAIYSEEAYVIPSTNLFIHYINDKLADIQGNTEECTYDLSTDSKRI